jgi:hypothetical protein
MLVLDKIRSNIGNWRENIEWLEEEPEVALH